MKESSCFLDGLFFYTPLHYEIQGLRKEVEYLQDNLLVEEVMYYYYDNKEVDKVIYKYTTDVALTEEEREILINYYVLCKLEDFLIVSEETEY